MKKVKTTKSDKYQSSSAQSNNNFAHDHLSKYLKNQNEYFSQRMRMLSNGPHDREESKKLLLAELYFQNW